jgi:hypothetical protein
MQPPGTNVALSGSIPLQPAPPPAGVTDDGFALYDSGEEQLRWSAPFPLRAIGTRIYITMNSIGWASVEGFFAEDGYVGG